MSWSDLMRSLGNSRYRFTPTEDEWEQKIRSFLAGSPVLLEKEDYRIFKAFLGRDGWIWLLRTPTQGWAGGPPWPTVDDGLHFYFCEAVPYRETFKQLLQRVIEQELKIRNLEMQHAEPNYLGVTEEVLEEFRSRQKRVKNRIEKHLYPAQRWLENPPEVTYYPATLK